LNVGAQKKGPGAEVAGKELQDSFKHRAPPGSTAPARMQHSGRSLLLPREGRRQGPALPQPDRDL